MTLGQRKRVSRAVGPSVEELFREESLYDLVTMRSEGEGCLLASDLCIGVDCTAVHGERKPGFKRKVFKVSG